MDMQQVQKRMPAQTCTHTCTYKHRYAHTHTSHRKLLYLSSVHSPSRPFLLLCSARQLGAECMALPACRVCLFYTGAWQELCRAPGEFALRCPGCLCSPGLVCLLVCWLSRLACCSLSKALPLMSALSAQESVAVRRCVTQKDWPAALCVTICTGIPGECFLGPRHCRNSFFYLGLTP